MKNKKDGMKIQMKKVLHYIYGLPPVRGGGLVRYALDLAKQEKKLNMEVVLLVPGPIYERNSSNIKVQARGKWNGLPLYKIINPLPIPMANGIRDIEWFTNEHGYISYRNFLNDIKPDIIHVHSLMGVHKSFFEAAHELKIKMVYTSHDYFGICPKTDFIWKGNVCCQEKWDRCGECCSQAFGTLHLMLDQSVFFQRFMGMRCADWALQKMITLKKCLNRPKAQSKEQTREHETERIIDYTPLESYYNQIWNLIDVFHFNSEVAEQVFNKRIKKNDIQSILLPICNNNCKDNRKIRQFGDKVRIGFLGNSNIYKGFSLLKEAADQLWSEGLQFELNVYFSEPVIKAPYMRQRLPYKSDDLEKVLTDSDLVVVPSIWKETFGLVVLEALSYGVPVIVTENVGAKILLENNEGIGRICKPDAKSLYECLKTVLVNPSILQQWNRNICDASIVFDMADHAAQLIEKCYGEENE